MPAPAPASRAVGGAALVGVLGCGAAIFVVVLVASIVRSPGIGGVLSGLFGGAFIALLFCAAGAWGLLSFLSPRAAPPIDLEAADALERALAPTLQQLETTRLQIVETVNARMAMRAPLCVGGALLVWVVGLFNRNNRTDVFDLAYFCAFAVVGAYLWSSFRLSEDYRKLYKERVLPELAAQFGDLSYRPAVQPDVAKLAAEGVFGAYDDVDCEDEIFGRYRGMPLRIVELKLEHGSGKERRTVFDGLVTELDLPRNLAGSTAVITDAGAFGNFITRMRAKGRERVALEDPRFEAVYEVYGADQISARALLTPAFMERFLALGERSDFGRPVAFAEGAKLSIVMPKRASKNLFEPPSYRKAAASREGLLELHDDLRAVLNAADAVIDLDYAARSQAAPI